MDGKTLAGNALAGIVPNPVHLVVGPTVSVQELSNGFVPRPLQMLLPLEESRKSLPLAARAEGSVGRVVLAFASEVACGAAEVPLDSAPTIWALYGKGVSRGQLDVGGDEWCDGGRHATCLQPRLRLHPSDTAVGSRWRSRLHHSKLCCT